MLVGAGDGGDDGEVDCEVIETGILAVGVPDWLVAVVEPELVEFADPSSHKLAFSANPMR